MDVRTATSCWFIVLLAFSGCVEPPTTDPSGFAKRDGPSSDRDGDGYTASEDCNDDDPRVNPGAVEICSDVPGTDEDCDPQTPEPAAQIGSMTYATIAEAVSAAQEDDVIAVCTGNHVFDTAIAVDVSIGIRSLASEPSAVQLVGNDSSLFEIGDGVTFTVESVTLTGGRGQIGGAISGGTFDEGSGVTTLRGHVVLRDVIATWNRAVYGGVVSADRVTVDNSWFAANSAELQNPFSESRGGAVHFGSEGTISGSTFVSNDADQGGAVFAGGDLTSSNNVFDGNESRTEGGAIRGVSTFVSSNDEFADNVGYQTGGALQFESTVSARLRIESGTFVGNHSARSGGAMNFTGVQLDVISSRFEGNRANLAGGALAGFESAISISSTMIADNHADGNGGALFINDGLIDIMDSTLELNSARSGGAITSFNTNPIVLRDARFAENRAERDGGAVDFFGVELVDAMGTTFEDNLAENNGGAVVLDLFEDGQWSGGTFRGGTASEGRGGGFAARCLLDSMFALSDTTFEDNTAMEGGALSFDDCGASVVGLTARDNEATLEGGALFVESPNLGTTLTFCELRRNTAPVGGAIIATGASAMVIEQSTVQQNRGTEPGLETAVGLFDSSPFGQETSFESIDTDWGQGTTENLGVDVIGEVPGASLYSFDTTSDANFSCNSIGCFFQ